MRLAIHRREGGDVAKGADRLCRATRRAIGAVLEDLDPVRVRSFDDLVDFCSLTRRMNDECAGYVRGDALRVNCSTPIL